MRYKDFYVRITPDKYIPRVDKKGDKILCEGFLIRIFADENGGIFLNSIRKFCKSSLYGKFTHCSTLVYIFEMGNIVKNRWILWTIKLFI